MVEVIGLTRRFAGVVAVRGVTFEATAGEILGVLGPNGAGKTTTLRVLCGYLPPTSGTARVDGFDVTTDSLAVRSRIGYLPENNPLYPEMRTVEYLLFRARLKGVPARERRARVDATIGRCGLAPVARQTIGTLSKGYRQRVGLADALVANPPVLVLDEPTSGLDPNQVHEVRDLVRSLRGEHTVLFSSHQLHEVEQVCDRVVIIDRGRVIAADTTVNLRSRAARGASITVEVQAADRDRLEPLADGLARIADVADLGDGWIRATLAAEDDPRAAIYGRAAASGLVLRELSRREVSLEAVFHELTLGGPPAEDAS